MTNRDNSSPEDGGVTAAEDRDEFEKPAFEYIRARMKETFNKDLSPLAEVAAEDIWENWERLRDGIFRERFRLVVHPYFHSVRFPSYSNFHMLKGGGILLIGAGLLAILGGLVLAERVGPVLWHAGAFCAAVGVGGVVYGQYMRRRDSERYRARMTDRVVWHQEDGGMIDLIAEYAAGAIGFETPRNRVFWPQVPSNVLSGKTRLVDGRTLSDLNK
jgi:hypothetical protein